MKKIKLNIGSGDVKFPKFTNLDNKFGDDITNLDYKDGSVDEIYASHVLEYFDQIEAVDVLREWYRVLKPEGIIRLAVPDFYELVNLYDHNHPIRDIMGPLFGRMKMKDKWIHHKTTYDFETLAQLLYQVGFKRVRKYDCESVKPHDKIDDCSHSYIPHMNKEGTLISLNVKAVK